MAVFYDILMPDSISAGADYGLKRRTDIVTLSNGKEERNIPQKHARRTMNISFGIRSLKDLLDVVDIWDVVYAEGHSFRVQWAVDWKSCRIDATPADTDQTVGVGDGVLVDYQLTKTTSVASRTYARDIKTPKAGTVLVALDGVGQAEGVDFTVDTTTGLLTFTVAPAVGQVITCGYEYDLIMRFNSPDLVLKIEDWAGNNAGPDYASLPEIMLIEVDK